MLGPLEVAADGQVLDLAGPRQRAVLAVLLVDVGRVVSVDRLIDQLWGDEPPAAATGSLQAYVSNLRRVLEPDRPPRAPATVLASRPPGYVLQLDGDQVDAVRFERRLAHARELLDGGHPPEAQRVAAEALGLWRGPAFADFTFEPFARAAITRLEELRLGAEEVHGEALLRSGDAAPAVVRMERLVAEHPLRERFRELLVWALYRAGRQADALRECDAARAALREELGVDPGPGLARLEAQILAQDPALGLVPPSSSSPASRVSVAAPPVPPADDRLFVGRATELAALLGAWSDAAAGRTRAVVLAGEAGVGKTRVAEELAAGADADGARVAWARWDENGGAPALWPWLTLLRELTGDDVSGPDGEASDPAGARLAHVRALQHLADRLVAASRERPVVAVLDDLQWADAGSVELLDLVVRSSRDVPLLLVVTVRTGADASSEVLARLARYDHVQRLDVSGLSAEDVAAYVKANDLGDDLAAGVHARTAGNAFFMAETVRLVASQQGDLATVPGTVIDVVRQRVGRLPDDTRTLLAVASVVGRSFGLELVRAACDFDVDRGLDALEPALLARLVVEDEAGLARFRFAHPIVQEALYAGLTPTRAARLHRRIADGLADTGAGVVEVAHHYSRAAAAGVSPRAVDFATRAAVHEEGRLAFAAAAVWRERAIALDDGAPASTRRHRLLVELGRAVWLTGDLLRSQDIFSEALALAEQLDDPELVVATAVRTASFTPWGWWRPGDVDLRIAAALERALDDGRLSPAAAVRGRAQLAVELVVDPDRTDEAVTQAAAAVTAARPLADPGLLAEALQAQIQLGTRPGGAPIQQPAAAELATLRPPHVPVEAGLVGQLVAACAQLALGDATGFDAAVEECWRLAAPRNQPALHIPIALARVTAALVHDDLDAAESASAAARRLYDEIGFPGGDDARAAQLLAIAQARGDLAGRAGELEALGAGSEYRDAADLLAGIVALETGDLDAVQAALRRAAAVPERTDFSWLYRQSLRAELVAATEDPSAAACYAALLPYADQVVTLATAIVCRGSVEHFLGLLARVVDPARAPGHFAAAAHANRRLGLRPWAERSEAEAAR